MEHTEGEIVCERVGDVLTISINRPLHRNALTISAAKLLHAELSRVKNDATLKILVLRGRGNDFCCGADIKVTASDDLADSEPLFPDPEPYDVTQLLYNFPAVTVAAIRGGCAGAAIGWACACDIRIACDSARFNTAFLDVGMAGDMAGSWFLTRLIGATRARELYFLPRKFDAAEASAMGLLTRVVADAEFEIALNDVIKRLEASAPLALRAIKANFIDGERLDLEAFIPRETSRHMSLYTTADRSEAFQAFLQKRRPRFVGR
jgi:2-(1,2-epoxy-1,2-dihydrophenyl)acetyl-CoA isomerase